MGAGHVTKRGSKWAHVHYAVNPSTGEGKHKWTSGFSTKQEAQRDLRTEPPWRPWRLSTFERG